MADEQHTFKVNDFALFKGFSTPLEEGFVAQIAEGDAVKIVKDEGEDGLVVVKVDPNTGEELTKEVDGQTVKITDRAFPEELTPAKMEAPKETKRTRKPATAEAAPAAEAPAATEAKATGKQKTKSDKGAKTTPAKSEAKAEAASVPAVATFVDVPSVKKLLESTDALKAAEDLINQAEATDFTLGGVLHHIHETGVYKSLGFDGKRGFDDYVEQKLGVASRKARYLMGSYVAFASLGVDTDKLEAIGWSKAKELARIPAEQLKKDYDKLVKLAGEKTRDELQAHITKKYTVATRGQSIKTTSFSFRYAEADGETITQALTRAKTMAGENADDNAAMLYIANDFLTGGTGSDLSITQMVELLAEATGLEVILTDADDNVIDPATITGPVETAASAEVEQELVPA